MNGSGARAQIRSRASHREVGEEQVVASNRSSQVQQQYEYKVMIEREQETIALIQDLKEALKEKEAELVDVKHELETVKGQVTEKEQKAGAFELQIINC